MVGAPFTLRPYQEECIRAFEAAVERRETRGLVIMATGLGKTACVAELAARRRARTFGVMHRDMLIGQAADAFDRAWPGALVHVEKAGMKADLAADVVLASIQTIGRKNSDRLARFGKDWPELLWIDEVHHAPAASYLNVIDHFDLYGDLRNRGLPLIGTTATPDRLDELGYDKIFDDVVFRYGLREAISDGWLADIHAWRIGSDLDLEGVRKRMGDFVEKDLADAVARSRVDEAAASIWKERCREKRNLFFCVDKAHAARLTTRLREAGAKVDYVVDSTHQRARIATIEAFRNGELDALVGVQVFTEGFDVPECDAVHILRPTGSGALYQQMLGRGTRKAPGKDHVDLFDYTPSDHDVFSVGSIFGLPDSWAFEGQSVSTDSRRVEELQNQIGLKMDGAKNLQDLEVTIKRDRIRLVKEALADTGLPSKFAWIRPNPHRERWVVAWKNENKGNVEKIHEKHRETVSETLSRKNLWGVREQVEVRRNELGTYEAILRRSGPPGTNKQQGKLYSDRSLSKLVSRVEKLIEEGRPHKVVLLNKRASWGKKEATDQQKNYLKQKGVPAAVAQTLSRREASSLMGMPEDTISMWFRDV